MLLSIKISVIAGLFIVSRSDSAVRIVSGQSEAAQNLTSRDHFNSVAQKQNITLAKISDDEHFDLLQKWFDQATSSLMSAMVMGRIKQKKLSKFDQFEHNKCTKKADTVVSHAKCVVDVLSRIEKKKKEKLHIKLEKSIRMRRFKRSQKPVNREHYNLPDEHNFSPMAQIAKKLAETVRSVKNKPKKGQRWEAVMDDVKHVLQHVKSRKKMKKELRQKFSGYKKVMTQLGLDPEESLRSLNLTVAVDSSEIEPDEPDRELTTDEKMLNRSIQFIREGIKLGLVLTGADVTNFDRKKLALFSPQFMSVYPNEKENDTISLFSPSMLSLHGKGSQLEQDLSMKSALKVLKDSGQDEWLDFVMEASGVTEAVDRIRMKEEEDERTEMIRAVFGSDKPTVTRENLTDLYGEAEVRKIDQFESLQSSLSMEQLSDMNSTGFTVMSDKQLQDFYGEKSSLNDSSLVSTFLSMPKEEVIGHLEENIRSLAREEMAFKVSRKKDIVLTPVVLTPIVLDATLTSTPIVLSPLLLSPLIVSPAVFGPLIISPWVFAPLIVGPRLLSPIILSPPVLSPLILSPLVLSPLILSPAVIVPLILSPLLLNPFILTPVVMVPLILNPFVLSPLIGVPNALSPFILSPFVLSPLILSPPYVSAFVLSPYAASPVIWSDGAVFTAVLSPSWLSSV